MDGSAMCADGRLEPLGTIVDSYVASATLIDPIHTRLQHVHVIHLNLLVPSSIHRRSIHHFRFVDDLQYFVDALNQSARLKKLTVHYSIQHTAWLRGVGDDKPGLLVDSRHGFLAPFERLKDAVELVIQIQLRLQKHRPLLTQELSANPAFKIWNPSGVPPLQAHIVHVEVQFERGSLEFIYLQKLMQSGGYGRRSKTFSQPPVLLSDWIKVYDMLRPYGFRPPLRRTGRVMGDREARVETVRRIWEAHRDSDKKRFEQAKLDLVRLCRDRGGATRHLHELIPDRALNIQELAQGHG